MSSNYFVMSISLMNELRPLIEHRASELGLNRSQYVQKLIARDLIDVGLIDEETWFKKMGAHHQKKVL